MHRPTPDFDALYRAAREVQHLPLELPPEVCASVRSALLANRISPTGAAR